MGHFFKGIKAMENDRRLADRPGKGTLRQAYLRATMIQIKQDLARGAYTLERTHVIVEGADGLCYLKKIEASPKA